MKIEARNAVQFVKHLQTLTKLSTNPEIGPYPISLLEQLNKLERKAGRAATRYCNGDISSDQWEKVSDKIKEQVNKLLTVKTLFINADPRGYALKLKKEEAKELGIYTDFGGYGILSPEF
jgi:hypothetical protein